MTAPKTMTAPTQHAVRSRRATTVAALTAVALAAAVPLLVLQPGIGAQGASRHASVMIETLAAGKPAISGESWVFVDREHRPYDITELRGTLSKLLSEPKSKERPELAPIVRVPTEGDQDVRWVIKQVLESGAMGIIVPQVENRERLLFEGGNHTLLTLEKALSGRRGEFSSQTLLVEADRDVSMDMLTRLNEIVRAAGFARVMYAVKPEEALAPGGAVNARQATAR